MRDFTTVGPSFFIVGAPKCGTTSLYAQLAQHPDIFMPRVKEPGYFDSDLYVPGHVRSLDQYLSHFEDARPTQLAGEASTSYLYSTRAATAIKEFDPDAKIIAMLRNPVEMMHSFHSQLLYQGWEEIEDFGAALDAEAVRRPRTGHGVGDRLPQVLLYRDVARFAEQLERYFDAFGRDQVLVILLDEYQRDPQRVYTEVAHFLGISPDFLPNFTVANRYKETRYKALHHFLTHPPEPVQRLVSRIVPLRARQLVIGHARQLNTRPGTRPAMDPELRDRLSIEFADEVETLGSLLGRDLSAWTGVRSPALRRATVGAA